jgi:hypothetical protein
MSKSRPTEGIEGVPYIAPTAQERWKRTAILIAFPTVGLLLLLLLLWNIFFVYVPPGHMLVIVAKQGSPLDKASGRVLAKEGEQGAQERVLGEGYHFVWPIIFSTEVHKNLDVPFPSKEHPLGQVGIVTNLGGVKPRSGGILADQDDEIGIRRHVLPPGTYRLNPYGYSVEKVDPVEIKPGFVGVLNRRLGEKSEGKFADKPTHQGLLREVLQPGLYYINTKEYQVLHREVGIYQTSYHYDADAKKNTALTFPVKDGNSISMDCTIEWELLPQYATELAAQYETLRAIEGRVVDQKAKKVSRDRGFNFGAQDWLEGDKREKFQTDFETELKKECEQAKVMVRSAYIRTIILPERFLEPKRKKQMEIEKTITDKAKNETALSDAEVESERARIAKAVAKVEAETTQQVALIDREVSNVDALTEAELEKIRSDYAARIGLLEAEKIKVTGEAQATVERLKKTAEGGLYKMQMDVFQSDGSAFLRYKLAEQLSPSLKLRLFQSGPGTLWTNMEGKNMNLLFAPGKDAPIPTRERGTPEK